MDQIKTGKFIADERKKKGYINALRMSAFTADRIGNHAQYKCDRHIASLFIKITTCIKYSILIEKNLCKTVFPHNKTDLLKSVFI